MSLYNKFTRGELTQKDIREWLLGESETRDLLQEEMKHVAVCLHHIYLWYTKNCPLGRFMTAVVKNNFTEACGMADITNSKVLPIYAKFLYMAVPADYRKKIKMTDEDWEKMSRRGKKEDRELQEITSKDVGQLSDIL